MARKRMFRLDVLETDAFMDMPLSTQALYFHLNLRADDDGFIGNPKQIIRSIGASQNDFDLLLAKKFVLAFDDGVIVIKHWRLHNTLTKDRYAETKYLDDKCLLKIKDNNSYTFGEEGREINDSRLVAIGRRQKTNNRRTIDEQKTSPVKNSKGKNSIDNIYGDFAKQNAKDFANDPDEVFEKLWKLYPKKRGKGSVSQAKKVAIAKIGYDHFARCIERYKKTIVGTNPKFVMYGSTFFNSGYVDFLDENYGATEDSIKQYSDGKSVEQANNELEDW